ncbi:MAG: hypothetical protein R3C05_26125 [Pirellulaceae bacterium]
MQSCLSSHRRSPPQTSLLVDLTADVAIVAYGIAWWFALSTKRAGNKHAGRFNASNAWYSTSVLLMFVHVGVAYAIAHRWSHRAAMEHAAIETRETLGFEFAPGLYVNFVFLLVFLIDTIWRWRVKNPRLRNPAKLACAIDGSIAFIFLMATLVFEEGPIRLVSAIGTIVIAFRYFRWKKRTDEGG